MTPNHRTKVALWRNTRSDRHRAAAKSKAIPLPNNARVSTTTTGPSNLRSTGGGPFFTKAGFPV